MKKSLLTFLLLLLAATLPGRADVVEMDLNSGTVTLPSGKPFNVKGINLGDKGVITLDLSLTNSKPNNTTTYIQVLTGANIECTASEGYVITKVEFSKLGSKATFNNSGFSATDADKATVNGTVTTHTWEAPASSGATYVKYYHTGSQYQVGHIAVTYEATPTAGPGLKVSYNGTGVNNEDDLDVYYGEELDITANAGANITVNSLPFAGGKYTIGESNVYTVEATMEGAEPESIMFMASLKKPEAPVITYNGTDITGKTIEVNHGDKVSVSATGSKYISVLCIDPEIKEDVLDNTYTVTAAGEYEFTAGNGENGGETSSTVTFTLYDPNAPTAATFTTTAQPNEAGAYLYGTGVTIACGEGCTMLISVDYYDESETDLFEVEGTTYTYTLTKDCTITATVSKVGYEDVASEETYEVRNPGAIVIAPEAGSIYADAEITLSGSEFDKIMYRAGEGEATEYTGAFTPSALGFEAGSTLTLSYYGTLAGHDFEPATATYTIIEKPKEEVYSLITNVNQLSDGCKILVVGRASGKEYVSLLETTSSGPKAQVQALTDGKIVLAPEQTQIAVFTLEKSESDATKFALKNQNGKYWAMKSTSGTATSYGDKPYYGSISVESNQHKIYLNDTRYIRMNSTTDFRGQSADNGNPVFIYLLEEPKEEVALESVSVSVDQDNMVTITYAPENAYPVPALTYSINGGEATEYTQAFKIENPNPTEETQVTVEAFATQGSINVSANETVTLKPIPFYILVSDMAQIETGAEYVLIAKKSDKYLAAKNEVANNKIQTVDVTAAYADNTCMQNDDMYRFVIEHDANGYYLKGTDGKYLNHSSSTNVNFGNKKALSIALAGNDVKIQNGDRMLLLNSSNVIGMYAESNYGGSSYTALSLYKRDGVASVQHVDNLAEATEAGQRYVLDADATVVHSDAVNGTDYADMFVRIGDKIEAVKVSKAVTAGTKLSGIAFTKADGSDIHSIEIAGNLHHLTATGEKEDVAAEAVDFAEVPAEGIHHVSMSTMQLTADGTISDIFTDGSKAYENRHVNNGMVDEPEGSLFNIEAIVADGMFYPTNIIEINGTSSNFTTPVASAEFKTNGDSSVLGCGYEFTNDRDDVAVFYTKGFTEATEIDLSAAVLDNGQRQRADAEAKAVFDTWATTPIADRPATPYTDEYYAFAAAKGLLSETSLDTYFGKTFKYDGEFIIAPQNLWSAAAAKGEELKISYIALRKTALSEIPANLSAEAQAYFVEVPAAHFAVTNESGVMRAPAEGNVIAVKSEDSVGNGGVTTGVENIGVEAAGNVEYYNLQGVRIDASNLTPGMYIRRNGNSTSKVIIR